MPFYPTIVMSAMSGFFAGGIYGILSVVFGIRKLSVQNNDDVEGRMPKARLYNTFLPIFTGTICGLISILTAFWLYSSGAVPEEQIGQYMVRNVGIMLSLYFVPITLAEAAFLRIVRRFQSSRSNNSDHSD
jgi:hypothetical protein